MLIKSKGKPKFEEVDEKKPDKQNELRYIFDQTANFLQVVRISDQKYLIAGYCV